MGNTAPLPDVFAPAAASLRPLGSRATASTSTFAAASWIAINRPRPRLAPVTIARGFERFMSRGRTKSGEVSSYRVSARIIRLSPFPVPQPCRGLPGDHLLADRGAPDAQGLQRLES